MDASAFVRGLLDDQEDPQQPQYVQANDFPARTYGLLDQLLPDPYKAAGDAVKQYQGGDVLGAFETMLGATPQTGMFLGRGAKVADHAKLAHAEKMADEGASRESIWDATGWFKGVDGKWRFEIPDNGASLKGYIQRGAAFEGKLPEVVSHDQAFDAYPNMKDIEVNYGQRGVASGAYAPPIDGVHGVDEFIRIGSRSDNPLSTALHEMQHAVQNREGFAPGGNNLTLKKGTPAWEIYKERVKAMTTPLNHETFSKAAGYEGLAPDRDYQVYLKMTKKPSPVADKAAQEYAANEAYRRSAGEVEARTTQKRMSLDADQRAARYPWLDYDVPENMQIVRGLLNK
jgi:hypothetical protein